MHLDRLSRRKFDVRGDAPDNIPSKNKREPSIAGTRESVVRWILMRPVFTRSELDVTYWKYVCVWNVYAEVQIFLD
jgi:hypothetical protein